MAFSMACPTTCGAITLVKRADSCILKERVTSPAYFAFIACDETLPDPIKGAIKPLFDSGAIVVSPPLGGFEFGEPSTVNTNLANCLPTSKIIVGRTIKFTDRTSTTTTSGSPAVTDKFADLPFWADKLNLSGMYYMMQIHCNGDAYLPRNGSSLIPCTLTGYIDYETKDEASNFIVQVKRFEVNFIGDPYAFNAPDFNIFEEGIVL